MTNPFFVPSLLSLLTLGALAPLGQPPTSAEAPKGWVEPGVKAQPSQPALSANGAGQLPPGGFSAEEPAGIPAPAPTPPAIVKPLQNSPTTAAQQPDGDADDGPPAPRGTCDITCRPGDVLEGEPDCADGSVDTFNGGCNSTPNVYSTIDCGQTVCGRYGTFVGPGGANFRDTDWYRFTLPVAANVTWTATGEAPTRVFLMQGTCPAVSLGTAAADPCMPASVTVMNLPAGTYAAFVGTDVFSGVPCGSHYRATLTVTPCCVGPTQPGDILEDEPDCADGSVDTFNGGCNSTPNVYSTIECGQTVSGRYGTFLSPGGTNFRDTDWYRFTLPVAANVTWTATGEARTRVFLMQGTCPAVSLGTIAADPCMPATVSAMNLPAGTYAAFVAPDVFTGVPCGSRYRATLMISPCCVGPTQPTDLVEGEPDCADGSVDAFNGGCNSTPNVYSLIDCGVTVSGRYGTFLSSDGANFRDTDWYHFTITQTSDVAWTATGEARTRLFILQGDCPASSLATAVGEACTPVTVSLNDLDPGTYSAFVATDAFSGVRCGARYRATLTIDPCCPVGRRGGDLVEGEPTCADGYVDNFNGGCNSTPNVFGSIHCGQSVAGIYGTYLSAGGASFRDTDWYRFTVTEEATYTWTAVGEARTRVFILRGDCPASSLATAAADACSPASVTIHLLPGTYNAFVGTDVFTGVPCGSRYRATLTSDLCTPCRADYNTDGVVNSQDFFDFLNDFFAGVPAADVNGDNVINSQDFFDFLNAFFAGC